MSVSHEEIIALAKGLTSTKFSGVAALAFLLYDHSLTFYPEVEYVWKNKWSFAKGLFLVNRYMGLGLLILDVTVLFRGPLTDSFCQEYLRWHSAFSIFAVMLGQIILICRIHAVYDRQWRVTGPIVAFVGCLTVFCFCNDFINLPTMAAVPVFTGCYLVNVPRIAVFSSVAGLINETMLFVMMLYKAWALWRENRRSPLLRTILRDSLLYYSTMFLVLLLNVVIWEASPLSVYESAIVWEEAIPCAIGSRLLLNIRTYYHRRDTVIIGSDIHSTRVEFRSSTVPPQRQSRRIQSLKLQHTYELDDWPDDEDTPVDSIPDIAVKGMKSVDGDVGVED